MENIGRSRGGSIAADRGNKNKVAITLMLVYDGIIIQVIIRVIGRSD